MFMGEYTHSIDAKGRVILPADFRQELGGSFIITKGLDGSLFLLQAGIHKKLSAIHSTREGTANKKITGSR